MAVIQKNVQGFSRSVELQKKMRKKECPDCKARTPSEVLSMLGTKRLCLNEWHNVWPVPPITSTEQVSHSPLSPESQFPEN